ncbi:MAG: ferritin-like domain-containing protein [Caldilineaceae bacterium]|nr:ferritin-like domain-containing protein [Caldilineaceae bacterium]
MQAAQVLELIDFAQSRRHFVRGSMAVLGSLALTTTAGLGRAFAQGLTDLDILQFALTLEHLEARMYQEMLAANLLTGKDRQYFTSFGQHEAAHVDALTQTITRLGGQPVAAQATYNFPAFDSRMAILNFAKVAEDTGVGAYQGAAAAITNKEILAAAGSIVQVEARHAAIVNFLLELKPVPSAVTASLTIDEVNAIVGPILAS